jgi:hypothetical protein
MPGFRIAMRPAGRKVMNRLIVPAPDLFEKRISLFGPMQAVAAWSRSQTGSALSEKTPEIRQNLVNVAQMTTRPERAPGANHYRPCHGSPKQGSQRVSGALGLHRRGQEAFALELLALELAGAAHGLGLFASALLGRLLVVATKLHLTEDALALHLLLEGAERLIDIVVANENLHVKRPSLTG